MKQAVAGAAGPKSLRRRAANAGGWSAVGFAASQGLRLISTLVMTRLLAPEMFGVMAIVATVAIIISLLTDLGVKQNIVQSKQSDDPVFLNTAWTVQILRGGIVWLVILAIAVGLYVGGKFGWLAHGTVYGAPVLPWILATSSFTAVLAGFQSTKSALAERAFNQRQLMLIDLSSQVVSFISMVGVAALSHSIWSLVVGQLTGSVVGTLLSHTLLPGPANRFAWNKAALHEIVAFGKWIFVSSFIGVFALQADRIVLGGLVSASMLGQFAVASTIVAAVEGVFSKLYSTILMPVLSEVAREDRKRLKEVFYRVRVPTDLMLLFCAGLLAALGGLVIHVLYDRRYADAGWMLQIMGLSLVWARYGAAQQLYLALAKPKFVALINVARFFAVFTALPLGYYFGGMSGALWGLVSHQAVVALISYRLNASLGLNDFGRDLGVLAALPVGYAVGLGVKWLVQSYS